MNILVPDTNAQSIEVAQALEAQAAFFPFARVCDVQVETFPKELGKIALTVSCIIYPGPVFRTETNMGLIRQPDTCKKLMAKMLQAIASVDLRMAQGDNPASSLKVIRPGGAGDPKMNGDPN